MCKESHRKVKEAVAKGWRYPKTENKIIDTDLVEAISLEVDSLFHKIQTDNDRLNLEFTKLKNWANDEDETDGYDVSDFIDHINSTVKDALKGEPK